MPVSDTVNREQFKAGLTSHQQGKTDYLAFIKMCAASGVESWKVCMDKMTCTYYDKAGEVILIEEIQQ